MYAIINVSANCERRRMVNFFVAKKIVSCCNSKNSIQTAEIVSDADQNLKTEDFPHLGHTLEYCHEKFGIPEITCINPERKQQSMQWRVSTSPNPKSKIDDYHFLRRKRCCFNRFQIRWDNNYLSENQEENSQF